MRLFGFTPVFWPTVISVPCFIAALALGTWQVERLKWKEGLIAERTAQLSAPPIALPSRVEPGDPALDFHHVRVEGRFHHDKELYLAARSLRGNTGWDVITPLERPDGSTVLVDRGWVPPERKPPSMRAQGQFAGTVTVEGIARTRFRKSFFQPDNDPAKNVWFWVDLRAMARAAGVTAEPVLVQADLSDIPGGLPKGGQLLVELPNNHLSYIVTWYSAAVAIAVIYVLWHRAREREKAKPR